MALDIEVYNDALMAYVDANRAGIQAGIRNGNKMVVTISNGDHVQISGSKNRLRFKKV